MLPQSIVIAALILPLLMSACCSSPSLEQTAGGRSRTPDPITVVLFHHAMGITPGIEAFAEELRAAGYQVLVPDLLDGKIFPSIEEGVSYVQRIGFERVIERGVVYARGLDEPLFVIGFSLGVLPAQKLAQTRPGVIGAVLCNAAVPIETFAEAWPPGVRAQLHFVEGDPWATDDLDAAREVAAAAHGELFLYPGTAHLVADSSHPDYDPMIAREIMRRTIALLQELQ